MQSLFSSCYVLSNSSLYERHKLKGGNCPQQVVLFFRHQEVNCQRVTQGFSCVVPIDVNGSCKENTPRKAQKSRGQFSLWSPLYFVPSSLEHSHFTCLSVLPFLCTLPLRGYKSWAFSFNHGQTQLVNIIHPNTISKSHN